jgi:murein DD-endopeptidase MepM/ murein hydrolase activator NlpD
MTAGFTARAATRLLRWFPERQIYHRSNGHVQFVVLSTRFQIISLAVGLSCMGWVAYSSVMTAFKNEIVAAEQQRVRDLQGRYESQIARMRLDYDDLSTKLALAEERFGTTVAAIEKRQSDLQTAMVEQETTGDALAEVTRRAETVRALGLGPDATTLPMEEDPSASGGIDTPEPPAAELPPAPAKEAATPPAPAETVYPEVDAPVPAAKPESMRAAEAAPVETPNAEAPVKTALNGDASDFIASGRNAAAGEGLAAIENRLVEVAGKQQTAAAGIALAATQQEDALRDIIEIAGMNPDGIAPRDEDAQGGPYIPMGPDAAATDLMARDPNLAVADEAMVRIEILQTAMLSIPFANPLPGVTRISSGFGGRSDPFNHGRAFHAGLDFKAAYGADITATAPGTVITADWHGGYGRMVEIDHGYGLKTRYAHMSAINVVEGQKVAFGDKVGELGSTGRSTGPHLHYEVWYDGQARNPWNYLKAGANVLQRQGS